MKGIPASFLAAFVAMLCLENSALAEDGSTAATPSFFQWYPDFGAAMLIGLGAVFGALVVVFTSVGGVLPGTSGKAKLDEEEKRYDEFAGRLGTLISAKTANPEAIRAVQEAVNNLRDDIRAEKRNQFALGGFLYVVLGTVVALALADDWLKAVAISAGWTGFLATFGLKADYAERSSYKTRTIAELQEATPKEALTQALQERIAVAKAI